MTQAERDEWADLSRRLHAFCVRRFSQTALAVSFELGRGAFVSMPLLPFGWDDDQPAQPAPKVGPQRDEWASGDEPKFASEFRRVYWPELGTFTFGPKQARVVEVLWEALQGGEVEMNQKAILAAVDSDCGRLLDLFRSGGKTHAAWGVLIVPGELAGSYRLADLPREEERPDERPSGPTEGR